MSAATPVYAGAIRPSARVKVSRRVCAAAVLMVCVLGLWAYLRYVGPVPGDRAILWHARSRPELRSSHLLQFLVDLGSAGVALLTVVIATAVVARAIGALGAATVLLSSSGVVVNEAVRHILGPTPSSEAYFGALATSYPSGHVVYATTVFGGLAWLAWQHGRRDAAVILAGLVVAMGLASVLSAAHVPSDVLGGYLLGGAWLLIALAVYDAARTREDGHAVAQRASRGTPERMCS